MKNKSLKFCAFFVIVGFAAAVASVLFHPTDASAQAKAIPNRDAERTQPATLQHNAVAYYPAVAANAATTHALQSDTVAVDISATSTVRINWWNSSSDVSSTNSLILPANEVVRFMSNRMNAYTTSTAGLSYNFSLLSMTTGETRAVTIVEHKKW